MEIFLCSCCGVSPVPKKVPGRGRARRICDLCHADGSYKAKNYRKHKERIAQAYVDSKLVKRCVVCAEPVAKFRTSFCSEKCYQESSKADAAIKDIRKRHRKDVAAKVFPAVIFDRDKWTCYLCGDPVEESLRGTRDPLAPEIDHVVPISRGGDHSAENVRCAHRRCNSLKNSLLLPELLSLINRISQTQSKLQPKN